MATFLTQDWLDLHRSLASDLPERPGATARIQIVVAGAPHGEVAYVQTIEDGRLVACALGRDEAADVTLTQTYADAAQIATGELDGTAAFMQGRAKLVGDMARYMAVMPLLQSPENRAVVASLGGQTEL